MSKKNNVKSFFCITRIRIVGMICTCLAAAVLILLGTILDRSRKNEVKEVTLYQADGTELAKIRKEEDGIRFDCELSYMPYVGAAWEEAKDKLGEEQLLTGKAVIRTCFDRERFTLLTGALDRVDTERYGNCAVCLTDTDGRVYAAAQKTERQDDNINYLLAGTSAGSAMKPLSVYGPALEEKMISWGTVLQDKPLFELNGEPWPVNAADYGGKDYLVSDSVKYSINTTAAGVLRDFGVEKSMDFLEERFGMDLSREREIVKAEGEDQVIGNLAFGALRNGVTVMGMAGYYQVFATGGLYQAPYTIEKIEMDGKEVYQHVGMMKRVFSEETAFIMNRLLKNVLTEGGTGAAAAVEGLDICGKTGTSDDFRDNWFVGVTPEYVLASWCGNSGGRKNGEKVQQQVFREIMEGLTHDPEKTYPVPEGVTEVKICKKTGKEAGANCKEWETGYFTKDQVPDKCGE